MAKSRTEKKDGYPARNFEYLVMALLLIAAAFVAVRAAVQNFEILDAVEGATIVLIGIAVGVAGLFILLVFIDETATWIRRKERRAVRVALVFGMVGLLVGVVAIVLAAVALNTSREVNTLARDQYYWYGVYETPPFPPLYTLCQTDQWGIERCSFYPGWEWLYSRGE